MKLISTYKLKLTEEEILAITKFHGKMSTVKYKEYLDDHEAQIMHNLYSELIPVSNSLEEE